MGGKGSREPRNGNAFRGSRICRSETGDTDVDTGEARDDARQGLHALDGLERGHGAEDGADVADHGAGEATGDGEAAGNGVQLGVGDLTGLDVVTLVCAPFNSCECFYPAGIKHRSTAAAMCRCKHANGLPGQPS